MVVFAKEGGQVGGQAVDELLPLLRTLSAGAGLEPLQVGRERFVAGVAQAARQAAVNHRLLALVQADAGMLVNQLADTVEVAFAEAEFVVDDVAD